MWEKFRENWAKYLALGITIFYVLVGLYVVIKPGWKEYRGDGFSFKYPPGFILTTNADNDYQNAPRPLTNEEYLFDLAGSEYKYRPAEKLYRPDDFAIIVSRFKTSEGFSYVNLSREAISRYSNEEGFSSTTFPGVRRMSAVRYLDRRIIKSGIKIGKYVIDGGDYVYEVHVADYLEGGILRKLINRIILASFVSGFKVF